MKHLQNESAIVRALLVVGAVIFLWQCGSSDIVCPAGQTLVYKACVGNDPPPGPCDGVDAPVPPGMGQNCNVVADCPSTAPYCRLGPGGVPPGACTIRDCNMGPPNCCPSDYSCQDLSQFYPGLPYVCR